jgi:hypothetical protein
VASEWTIDTLREYLLALRDADNASLRRELVAGGEELLRRLEILNHAHDNMVLDRSLLLRIEVYDKSEELHRVEREVLSRRVGDAETRLARVTTLGGALILFVPWCCPS